MPLGRNGKCFKACLVLTLGIAKELVAVQTLPIGLCAGGRAACGNLCDALKVVALGRDHASVLGRLILALRICKELLADGALPCFLFARFGAGRGCSLKLIEVVTRCRNDQCIGGRLVLALGIQEQLAAHFAAPISLLARLRAGCRFFGVRDKRMAVGAGIGGTVGQLDVIDGVPAIVVRVVRSSLLCEVEGKLRACGQIFLRDSDLSRSLQRPAAGVRKLSRIPDDIPGLAAIGRSLDRKLIDALEQRGTMEQVVKAQRRTLAGQIDRRRDEVLILRLIAAGACRLHFVDAPAIAGIIIEIIQIDACLTCGVQVAVRADIPCAGGVGVRGLDRPAVTREIVLLEVVIKLDRAEFEAGGNGMSRRDIFEGVGLYHADALTIHEDICDLVAACGFNLKGLGRALLDGDFAVRGDCAALARLSGDGVLRGDRTVLHGLELDIIDGKLADIVVLVHIMERKLCSAHGVIGGNFDLGAAGDDTAALALVAILEVPDCFPRLAAVNGSLDGRRIGLVLCAIDAVGIFKAQNRITRAGQIDRRGDQQLVLLDAIPVIGDISVHGVTPCRAVVAILLPCEVTFVCAVRCLDLPAVEREDVARDGLEVVLEVDRRHIRDGLELCAHAVALIHGQVKRVSGNIHGAAVELDALELIAAIRRKRDLDSLVCGMLRLSLGRDRAALACQRGQNDAAGGRAGHGELGVVNCNIACVGCYRLIVTESKLHSGGLIGCGNVNLGKAGLEIAGAVFHVVLRIPDGAPGLAAVGGGLDRKGHLAAVKRAAGKAVIEGKLRRLAGQIDHRGDKQFILLRTAGPVLLIVFVGIHDCLHVRSTGRNIGIACLMPRIAAVGLFDRPALSREVGSIKIVVKERNFAAGLCLLEGHGDRMILTDTLEGIVADRALIDAVDPNVLNLITLICSNGKGLAGALLDERLALGRDGTALACRGIDLDVILTDIGVEHDIVKVERRAALAGIDKREAQILAALELFGDRDLSLRLCPRGEQAGIALEVPDLLPVRSVVGGHDQEVAVLVFYGIPIGGVEIKDHVRLGLHAAQIGRAGIEPLVLLIIVVVVNGGGVVLAVVLAAIPGIRRAALGLNAPTVGEPCVVEVFRPEDVRRDDGRMIVGVAGNLDVIALGVSGVVMHDHADGLAHAGHVVLLDVAGHTGLHLTEALLTVEHLMVGHIVEDDRRDILVVRHVEVQVVAALGLGDLQVLGLRFLGIDRNGEFPRVLEVLAAAVAVRQGRLDADGRLGIIGQLGIVRIGAVPRRDAVIFHVNACGRDAVIVVAVNGLGNILADLAVIYLAVFTGNGILQALCVAQQARVDARQTVLKVVVVRRNGVAVGKVRNLCVAVLADVGIDRVLAGGGECGVHIRLRLAG